MTQILLLLLPLLALTAPQLPALASPALAVHIAASDCHNRDCRSVIDGAVAQCRAHGPGCSIVLGPGSYTVGCPAASRPSTTQTESPAVSLADLVGPVSFGGAAGLPRPELLIDYTFGGCGAIVATNASDVTVEHLAIDALRLPFTVGILTEDASPTTVRFRPEAGAGDRPDVYAWDPQRWAWLDLLLTTQVVMPGTRATRELQSNGMLDNDGSLHTSSLSDDGVVTIEYTDNRTLSPLLLRKGERIFIKHFNNMQSWGVHGRNATDLSLANVSLWSVSGMGYRCDLCLGEYSLTDSDVSIKPGADRPMSITADAVHFMHHKGHIELLRSSFQGQGDDGFNVHGNFIVLESVINASSVRYVDETGPGWISAAPTYLVGDEVEFFNRRTLQRLGMPACINERLFFHVRISFVLCAMHLLILSGQASGNDRNRREFCTDRQQRDCWGDGGHGSVRTAAASRPEALRHVHLNASCCKSEHARVLLRQLERSWCGRLSNQRYDRRQHVCEPL